MGWSKLNPLSWFRKDSATARFFTTVGFGGVVHTKQDYRNFAKESYLKNVIAYRSVLMIAQAVASVGWKLFKNRVGSQGKKRQEVENHQIVNLWQRPNPQEGIAFLLLQLTAYLSFAGNSYLERVAPLTGPNKGIPQELYVLRPDRMKVVVDTQRGILGGFEFEHQGRKKRFKIDPISLQGDILQFKAFHPLDDWYGLADTQPTARHIDTSNAGIDYNLYMFQNEGRPGMIVEYPENMGTAEFEVLERKMREKFSGVRNPGRNMILTAGGKAHAYDFKPKEMDLIKTHDALARRVAIGYGVFPMLLGIPGEATFANFEEARLAFWEQTVFWYLNYFKGELNNWLFFNQPEFFLDFVLDGIPALEPKRKMLWDRAQSSSFLTINEKRGMVGLEDIEDGDVVLVPSTLIPLGESGLEEEVIEEEE